MTPKHKSYGNEAELEALVERRVVDGDSATVEEELMQEQDEIEFAMTGLLGAAGARPLSTILAMGLSTH